MPPVVPCSSEVQQLGRATAILNRQRHAQYAVLFDREQGGARSLHPEGQWNPYAPVERLWGAFREVGASHLVPGAAVRGRCPERGSSGEGESGVNLGDGGPEGGTLSLFPPEVVVSLRRVSSSAVR
jgi:hypothetical protein